MDVVAVVSVTFEFKGKMKRGARFILPLNSCRTVVSRAGFTFAGRHVRGTLCRCQFWSHQFLIDGAPPSNALPFT